jgi:hypothetical protein
MLEMFTTIKRAVASAAILLLVTTSSYAQFGTRLLTNKSGGLLADGSIVIADSTNDESVTTTTTARLNTIAGVVAASAGIANNATGTIVLQGIADVLVTGTVTRGDYVVSSTTAAKAASGGTTNSSGSMGIALETGTDTLVSCVLMSIGQGGSSIIQLNDDTALIFGTDSDIQMLYDEATDNRFEVTDGTNLLMALTDAGTTGDLYVSGNAGIGTATPDGTLHAHTATAGSVTANASADDLIVENSSNTGISILAPDANNASLFFGTPTDNLGAFVQWDYDASTYYIGTNDTGGTVVIRSDSSVDAITIDSSQDVGIKVTTPDNDLHVQGASGAVTSADYGNASDVLVVENDSNSIANIIGNPANFSAVFFSDDVRQRGEVRYTHSSDDLAFYTAATKAMTIDSSQQVGIGLASPSSALDVSGDVEITGTLDIAGYIFDSGSPLQFNDTTEIVRDSTEAQLAVETYSTTLTDAPILNLQKSATTSLLTFAETANGDHLGEINFKGVDTTSSAENSGRIRVTQVGAAGTRVAGKMEFSLAPDSTTSVEVGMTLNADKSLVLEGDLDINAQTIFDGTKDNVTINDDLQIQGNDIQGNAGSSVLRMNSSLSFTQAVIYTPETVTDDVTPAVGGSNGKSTIYIGAWTLGSITDFDGETAGQVLLVIGTGTATPPNVTDGAGIELVGGTAWTAADNAMLSLYSDGTTWYEMWRSAP